MKNKRHIECGELPAVETKEREPAGISGYVVSEPRAPSGSGRAPSLPMSQTRRPGGRAYGIMMHEILSRVTTTDIEKAVSHACATGLMPLTGRDTAWRLRNALGSGEAGLTAPKRS